MSVAIVLFSALLFCAMILNLAAKPKFTRGLIGACALISAIGGLILYGIGFSYTLSDPVLRVVRTVLAVSRMYAGINDYASVSAAPMYSHLVWQILFWIIHLMAFYATASASISAPV